MSDRIDATLKEAIDNFVDVFGCFPKNQARDLLTRLFDERLAAAQQDTARLEFAFRHSYSFMRARHSRKSLDEVRAATDAAMSDQKEQQK